MFSIYLINAVTSQHAGKGIDTVPPIFECPGGFVKGANGCSMYEEVLPDITCPKGSHLDVTGHHCESKTKSEPMFRCPVGSIKEGKKCVKRQEAHFERRCAKGYTSDGFNCVRTEKSDHSTKCPKEFKFIDGQCYKHEKCKDTILTCAAGFLLEGKECHSYSEEAPYLECKKGELVGMECIEKKHESPEFKCPKEYHLEGNMCHGKKSKHSETVCAIGEKHGKECIYEVNQPPVFECKKKDFKLLNGKCVKIEEENPEISCPKDYKMGHRGDCVREIREKTRELCEGKGDRLVNGICESNDIKPADISCKDKKTQRLTADGRCLSKSKHGVEVNCPKGYKLDNGLCLSVTKEKPHEICDDTTVIMPAERYCKHGEMNAQGECVTVDYREPKEECPKGFYLDGNTCVSKHEVAGEEVCQHGTYKGGHCEVSLKSAPRLACKGKDYVLTANGYCSRAIHQKGHYTCPSGYSMKEGACHRETIQIMASTVGDVHQKKDKKQKEKHHGHEYIWTPPYVPRPQIHSKGYPEPNTYNTNNNEYDEYIEEYVEW